MHTIQKIDGKKWHIISPDGVIVRNGFHEAIAFTQYWDAIAFCQSYQISYRFA